jgi:hypothetical protein
MSASPIQRWSGRDAEMELSMSERKAVTRVIAARYSKASKADKGTILDEVCALTGRHARRAIRWG